MTPGGRARRGARSLLRGDPTARALLDLESPSPRTPPPRRIVFVAALLALGIILGDTVIGLGSVWLFAIAISFALCIGSRNGRFVKVVLSISVVCAGAGLLRAQLHERSPDDIANALTHDDAILRVEGTIRGPIEFDDTASGALARFSFGGASTRFRLDTTTLIGLDGARTPVTGTLLARCDGDARKALWAGRPVHVTGSATALRPPMNPGAFDAPRWGAANGISGRLSTEEPLIFSTSDASRTSPIASLKATLEMRADAWVRTIRGDRERALVAAMLLGDRGDDLEDTELTFRRVGLAHVLAISGLHVGLMVWLAIMALRLTGDRPRLHALALVLALGLYLLIVPARTPIVRTAILSLALIASEVADRRYDRLTLLAWVMIAVLIWRPVELFSAGFQLSFGVVAALMTLHAPLRARLFGYRPSSDERTGRDRVIHWAQDGLVAAILSWAVSLPVVAYHFGVVSSVGVLATVLVLPFITVLLALAYLALAVGVVWTGGASLIAAIIAPVASLVLALAGLFEAIPLAEITVPRAQLWWVVLATACAVWWILRGTWRAPIGFAITPALLLVAVVAWFGNGIGRGTALRVDMLSVGDGTCILLRTPGESMLYDCGSRSPSLGLRTIPDALRALGVHRVTTIAVSHPNTDHFNAIPDLAQRLGMRTVVTSPAMRFDAAENPDGASAAFIDMLDELGVTLRETSAGDALALGGLSFDVLSPVAGHIYENVNDNSLVLRAHAPTTTGETTLLLTGDIERGAIADLLDAHPDLRADIAEIPHHGSARPAAMSFIESVDPAIALQSTGPSRLGDERWADVRLGRDWRVTARDGAVSVTVRRDGEIVVRTFRGD